MITKRRRALIQSVTRLAAVSTAILMLTVLTVTRSQAAFTASTSNTGSSVATNSVVITDDDAGSALFTATGMTPGSPLVECIAVTYSGTALPAPIRMYGTTTGTLDTYIDLTIEEGSGGTFGNCAGFTLNSTLFTDTLENYATTHTNWASGLAVTTAAANPTTRTLRFTIEVQDNPAAQSDSATMDFTFEAQS